ncbi:hypothetical protein FV223_28250, partial [Methylobacterium sp. WL116]
MTDTAPSLPPLLPAGTSGIPISLVAKDGWPRIEAGLDAAQRTYAGAIGFAAKPGQVESLAESYAANPNDLGIAMRYAQALRATDQRAQA